ncbi:hypothetical protein F2Q70_00020734 [Brassica cretica]|uniref:Uncharacterized protein n=1 Tax=Brassica cretica TaxID=69181 RepID=A0A8S9GRQ7_BRACR|nr:hypothetical protein F2Q70_00020734 [Brassica cretica]
MSVCELKEHHTDATKTVNNLCNKLRQRRLQLLNTDGLCFSSSSSQSICSGLGLLVPSNSNSYLESLKTEPGETDSSQRLVLSAGASQNNRSRKIKELDKKAKNSSKKKNKSLEWNEKLSYVHARARVT